MTTATQLRLPADFDLARRCAGGDRLAQRELFYRERDRVHAILYRLVGSNSDMEDLVQDAFIEIFRSLATFRGEASLATWLDRIAVRVGYAYLGKKRGDPVRLLVVPEPVSHEPGAEQRVMTREATRRLYAVLDRIVVPQRVAFTLHVIDGRPLKDVAEAMGASLVATKVRVWRAWRAVHRAAARDPLIAELLDGGRPLPTKRGKENERVAQK